MLMNLLRALGSEASFLHMKSYFNRNQKKKKRERERLESLWGSELGIVLQKFSISDTNYIQWYVGQKRQRETPGGPDASQQTLCRWPQGKASREVADGLSATTAMLLYTALVTKAGVWRLRAKSTSGFQSWAQQHISVLSLTSWVMLSQPFYQPEPLLPQGCNEDKTTHLAGLLGAWNEITYVKNFCSVPHMK